jgi:Kef-type K+ transport system membrane component KefB
VPSIVLELVAGIIVGPRDLGIASATTPVEVFSTVGLACLLFLATALVAAGLVLVVVFPALAFSLVGKPEVEAAGETPELDIGLTPS